jgi:hypothetical protein
MLMMLMMLLMLLLLLMMMMQVAVHEAETVAEVQLPLGPHDTLVLQAGHELSTRPAVKRPPGAGRQKKGQQQQQQQQLQEIKVEGVCGLEGGWGKMGLKHCVG